MKRGCGQQRFLRLVAAVGFAAFAAGNPTGLHGAVPSKPAPSPNPSAKSSRVPHGISQFAVSTNSAGYRRLENYLHRAWPAQVTSVRVGRRRVRMEGTTNGRLTNLDLAEIPPFAKPWDSSDFVSLVPLTTDKRGRFAVTVKRRVSAAGRSRDRLLSRWAVVRRRGAGWQCLSSARFADSVTARWSPPAVKRRSKKGLGGFSAGRGLAGDLDQLGIASVTVNIVLNSVIHLSPAPGRTAFVSGGRTWFTDNATVAGLDRTLRETARRHIIVSAIILVAPTRKASQSRGGSELAYPGTTPAGIFAMPNVTSQAGVAEYAAALDFLAQRYGRPDGRYGRINDWIIGNEVDSGWIWTNAGEQSALNYMDLYQRALRIADLVVRQYDSRARVFISLDHFWSNTTEPHCYPSRRMLDDLLTFSKVEGDFDWGIAFHPYPQNLFDPRVWRDTQATTNLDSPMITFKNIGVLVRWAQQPQARFRGKFVRAIHLTEQGFNSKDYSKKSLEEQAAGLAYAWHKIEHINAIQEMDYHNWIDNRGEGGLRIGLRKFPDDPTDPLGRKPIWYLYQALGTPREKQAMAFALPIIGITNWSQVR